MWATSLTPVTGTKNKWDPNKSVSGDCPWDVSKRGSFSLFLLSTGKLKLCADLCLSYGVRHWKKKRRQEGQKPGEGEMAKLWEGKILAAKFLVSVTLSTLIPFLDAGTNGFSCFLWVGGPVLLLGTKRLLIHEFYHTCLQLWVLVILWSYTWTSGIGLSSASLTGHDFSEILKNARKKRRGESSLLENMESNSSY